MSLVQWNPCVLRHIGALPRWYTRMSRNPNRESAPLHHLVIILSRLNYATYEDLERLAILWVCLYFLRRAFAAFAHELAYYTNSSALYCLPRADAVILGFTTMLT